MTNVAAIKQDIAKMIDLGAPEADIDAYVAAHGLTAMDFQPSTGEKIVRGADALAEGAQTGFSKIGTGIIQTGAEVLGADRVVEASKKAAANLENKSNRLKERNPIMGTVGEMAPYIASGGAANLPTMLASGFGLGFTSPEADQSMVEPSQGTAFERVMGKYVGQPASKLVEMAGIDPQSRLGKGALGAGLAGASYGTGKGVSKLAQYGNAAARPIVRGLTKLDQDAIQALQQSGIDPTLQLASNSQNLQSIANSMQRLPLVGGRLESQAGNAINKLESNVGSAANKLGTASDAIEGGAALQRGLRSYEQGTGAKIEGLYNKVDEAIPPQTPANLTNTRQFAQDYLNRYPDAPSIGAVLNEPKVEALSRGVITDANPSYRTLKNLRTDIGEQAGKMDAPSAYKQLYGAASEDMRATAQGVSPEAAQAAARANNYYRAVTQRNEKLARFFDQNKDGTFVMSPEKATQATRSELQLLKKSIPKADFNDYTSSVVRKLGEAPAGAQNATGDVFSPNTFLTNFTKLKQSGKADVLFDKNTSIELGRAAKVAERFRQLGKAANASNTTNAAVAAGSMWGMITKPIKTTAMLAPAYGLERLLTSPKALKVINDYAYRPVVKNAKLRGEFSAKLLQAAGQDAELHDAAKQYLGSMPNEPLRITIRPSDKVDLYDDKGIIQ